MSRSPFPRSVKFHMLDYWQAQVVRFGGLIEEELRREEPDERKMETYAVQVSLAEEKVAHLEGRIAA